MLQYLNTGILLMILVITILNRNDKKEYDRHLLIFLQKQLNVLCGKIILTTSRKYFIDGDTIRPSPIQENKRS